LVLRVLSREESVDHVVKIGVSIPGVARRGMPKNVVVRLRSYRSDRCRCRRSLVYFVSRLFQVQIGEVIRSDVKSLPSSTDGARRME
jgi:hypothetical protein